MPVYPARNRFHFSGMHKRRKINQEHGILNLIASASDVNLEISDFQIWLVENICQILWAEAGGLLLFHDDHAEQTLKCSLNEPPNWIFFPSITWNGGVIEEHIQNNTPLRLEAKEEYPTLEWYGKPSDLKIRTILMQPLKADDKYLGCVAVFNKQRGGFSSTDHKLLEFIAQFIADSIHKVRLIQQLKVANANLEVNHWQLLRSRNILRALFDSIPSSFYIVDRKYNLIAVNNYRANRLGIQPSSLVSRRCYEALYHHEDICPDCRVIESLFGGINTTRTMREWKDDEDPLEWEINTYPILDDADQVIQAIILEQDVTEKRRLETNLAQSEKLAAVGQLAAGLAHEINNPLTAIIANTQLLQREIAGDQDTLELVDLISRAGLRAAQVVRNLLDLARKEEYNFVAVDINLTIRRAIDLLQHEIVEHNINLIFEPHEPLSQVMASEDHLQGVWVNLISNAIDAMEDNPKREIIVATQQQGNEIRIIVTDTGKGIPNEKINRIFEPFYTTKAPGRGTGLGLSLCHRVIKQHGGVIHVDSKMGSGAKFTVTLPVN